MTTQTHQKLKSALPLDTLSDTLCKVCYREVNEVDYLTNSEPYLVSQISKFEDKGERDEAERLKQTLSLHEARRQNLFALLDLWVALDRNPYPGKQLRLFTAATKLLPDYTYEGFQGEAAWKGLIQFYGKELDCYYDVLITFPVKYVVKEIDEIEHELFTYCHTDSAVPVTVLTDILDCNKNSKYYRAIKQQLESKGWSWHQRRRAGEIEWAISRPVNFMYNNTTTVP
jgi:RNAse (barnase) inhibitor barstar